MQGTSIYLSEILSALGPLTDYKIHFAKCSYGSEPLDAFVRGMDEWKQWNEYCPGKDAFNRPYIFSLISFYPERDTWLFGGIWKVNGRNVTEGSRPSYSIDLCPLYEPLIGRLKISCEHKDRQIRNNMEAFFPQLVLKGILPKVYSSYAFPGYKNLDVPFKTLETVMQKDDPEWRNPLSLKGIYMITDTKTGKRYVGKADGEQGIWQRWRAYIHDGHGGDVDLKHLVKENGFAYVQENYKFTLLEIVDGTDIDDRETYWKRVMLSRLEEFGHNKN